MARVAWCRARWMPLCSLVLVLALLLGPVRQAFSQPVDSSGTVFYLHTAYGGPSIPRRIMSTDPPYGIQRWSSASEIIPFSLYPPLGRTVKIGGTVSFQLWLRASAPTIGIVNATLVETTGEGKTMHVCGIEAPVLIESVLKEQAHSFSVGPIVRTVSAESTLMLYVVVKDVRASVFLHWDDNRAPSRMTIPFVERYYHVISMTVRDFSDREMKGANITISQSNSKVWTGLADGRGLAEAILPSTEDMAQYDISVHWKNVVVSDTRNVSLTTDTELILRCQVYDLAITVQDFFGMPLSEAKVELAMEGRLIASDRTGSGGILFFDQTPGGNYVLVFTYGSFEQIRKNIAVSGSTRYLARLEILPLWFYYGATTLFAIAIGSGVLLSRRQRKLQRISFDFLNDMLLGKGSMAGAVMVIGAPGSGKSVLMQKVMHDQLARGGKCVFVTNNDFPRKIVEDMKELGLDVARFERESLAFIDCYSGAAGRPSTERYSIQVLTDLTNLGTQISSAANALGEGTTFFLDSLAPLFASLKPDPILTFIHTVGARIKGQGGSLYFSVGTGLDKDVLSRLEGLSDCIIELDTYERKGTPVKRLRIKKIRGRRHPEKWMEFSIEAPYGIVFYGPRKQLK